METVINAEQTDIFDYLNNQYTIKKPIRLIELFAGIGSQAKALERLGANFEHYKAIEFDKFAIRSYNAVHGTNFETSDITQIHADDLEIKDTDQYEYIMTYSFPCQDLSLAGKQKGMSKGSNTRSGLLWEVERLLDECDELPQVLLMENVPQVIGKKNIEDFRQWQSKLESLGYSNFVEILNAKDYGIPQNRKRCFMVSILGYGKYFFPEKIDLKYRLKDFLELSPDERYFLNSQQLSRMNKWKSFQNPLDHVLGKESISPTITTRIVISDQGGINASTKLYCNDFDDFEKLRNEKYEDNKIRVFTEIECWKLMGFDENDFKNASASLSEMNLTNNQINGCLYKQAGNSIVVDVLYHIFKQMM